MYSPQRLGYLAAGIIAALALGACATVNVGSFSAKGVDFKQYRTYDWAPTDQLETGDPRLDNNPFFLDQLQGQVERRLAAKGYEKATSGTPALILHYHASVTQRLDLGNVDPKYYDPNKKECNGCGPFIYDEGSLVIDFVDAKTDKLVWRGWAEGSIDGVVDRQDRMDETIDQAVARIFAKLPRVL